jgi:hypothetical protein
MSTGSRSLRLADQLARQPYVWPGGYPLHGVTDDGGVICRICAVDERESIALTDGRDGWCLISLRVNWEDPELRCDCCGRIVEAAYGNRE